MPEKLKHVRNQVGATIRRMRNRRELSLEDLADRVGHDAKYLGMVELGKANPSLDTLTRIAGGLSVKVAEFFGASHVGPDAITEDDFDSIENTIRVLRRLKKARSSRSSSESK
jgi:transcriptional regulator with XRE-family HTH domain